MRQSIWEKRFPTLIGLLILVVSILTTTYMVRKPQLFELGATPSTALENLRISNQTATSVSISFTTEKEVQTLVRLGTTLKDQETLFDDRDAVKDKVGVYKTHHFTASKLSPLQTYVFTIVSQATVFDNNGAGFTLRTGPSLPDKTHDEEKIEPIRGTVFTSLGQRATNALVFVKIDQAALLSAVTSSEGQFLMPLTNLYTSDLTGFYSFRGDEILSIEVIGNDGSKATLKAPFSSYDNLPAITLGKNIDLIAQSAPVESPQSSGFQAETNTGEPDILTPKDGDFLIDQKPLFRGIGIPGQKVEITIESERLTAEVTVDENGNWTYQPDSPLAAGKHTVSARFFDGTKATKVLQNQFEVFASGNQVSEPATPSATPSLSPSPSLTILPTKAPIPTTATILPSVFIVGIGLLFAMIGGLVFVTLRFKEA